MLSVFGGWRLPLLEAMVALSNYSTAACEAMVVVCECSDVLLKTALAYTNSVSLYLSAMLQLNAVLRLALAGGVRFSREDPFQRRRSSCSARPSSRAIGDNCCSPLCWGEATSAEYGPERRSSVRSALRGVHALCRCALSVLCGNVGATVSSMATLCGYVIPALTALRSVTGF